MEVMAAKPGNVSPQCEFPNLKFHDLLRSADIIAHVLDNASERSVGATILACIRATRTAVNTNTNLGIVLLLAPLASVPLEIELWSGVCDVLNRLTIQDAIDAYEAIRLAEPGGLGEVENQDVHSQPTVTLKQAMALAADRDLIARQYVTGFEDVIAGAQHLAKSIEELNPSEGLVVDLHLWFLSRGLDSLVLRKRGDVEARELQGLAKAVRESHPSQRAKPQAALEKWFADEFPHRNPGTTADLVCASLFVALRTGIIPLP